MEAQAITYRMMKKQKSSHFAKSHPSSWNCSIENVNGVILEPSIRCCVFAAAARHIGQISIICLRWRSIVKQCKLATQNLPGLFATGAAPCNKLSTVICNFRHIITSEANPLLKPTKPHIGAVAISLRGLNRADAFPAHTG